MFIYERSSGKYHEIEIIPVDEDDYTSITKSRYWFNWKEEKDNIVYKLQIAGSNDIKGLISLGVIKSESRILIRLLAVSKENRGEDKRYENIVGCLIAFAGKLAIKLFGEWACISLIPKTKLKNHYKKKYFMIEGGKSLFLDGNELIKCIRKYDHE